jgi:hypothetical protein
MGEGLYNLAVLSPVVVLADQLNLSAVHTRMHVGHYPLEGISDAHPLFAATSGWKARSLIAELGVAPSALVRVHFGMEAIHIELDYILDGQGHVVANEVTKKSSFKSGLHVDAVPTVEIIKVHHLHVFGIACEMHTQHEQVHL